MTVLTVKIMCIGTRAICWPVGTISQPDFQYGGEAELLVVDLALVDQAPQLVKELRPGGQAEGGQEGGSHAALVGPPPYYSGL